MRRAKRLLQWLVGIVVGLYLAVTVMVDIPFVQRWLANGVETVLENILDTRVGIGRVEIEWNGRLIVTDLVVDDQQGEEMLRVARVAARMNVNDLIQKRIRIGNAQLFGMRANLYQECEGCPPNFKFLINAFASKDTTRHTPLDLRISQILVRRGHVRWRERWHRKNEGQNPDNDSARPKFDMSDMELNDLNVTAQVICLTDDSLSIRVKRFDVREKSGLAVKSLAFSLEGSRQGGTLKDFHLQLPGSNVEIPMLEVRKDKNEKIKDKSESSKFKIQNSKLKDRSERNEISRWEGYAYQGSLEAHLSPADFTSLLPTLPTMVMESGDWDVEAHFDGKGDQMNVSSLHLHDSEGRIRLAATGWGERLSMGKDSLSAMVSIQDIHTDNRQLRPYLQGNERLYDMLLRLGRMHTTGQLAYHEGYVNGYLEASTSLGDISLTGNGTTKGNIEATLQIDEFQLGELLAQKDLGIASLDLTAKGMLGKRPVVNLRGRIPEVDYKGYRYRNVEINNLTADNGQLAINLASDDPNASVDIEGEAHLQEHTYRVKANVRHMKPHTLNLTNRYLDTDFSGILFADIKGKTLNDLEGLVHLNDLTMTDSAGTYRPGDIHLTARRHEDTQHLLLISPFLEAQVEGDIEPKSIGNQIKKLVSNYLPAVPLNPPVMGASNPQATTHHYEGGQEGAVAFTLRAYNAEPLHRLLGIPLTLSGTTKAYGKIDSKNNALWANLTSPGFQYGNEKLRDINLHLESNYEALLADLRLQRQMKGKWINLGLDTKGFEGKLITSLSFSNKVEGEEEPERDYSGDVNIISRLWKEINGKQGFEGQILESNFTVSDTLWTVHPGSLTYHDGTLQVDSFRLSQGSRFISLEGRASKSESDVLHAQLQSINLEYIFSLINFHAVELTGEATGHAYAHSLFASPRADAYIHIPQFALNYATLGDLDIHVNWGDRPYSIHLDGKIDETLPPTSPHHEGGVAAADKSPSQLRERDLGRKSSTLVKGYITPKKDISYHGIDLNVQAERVNMAFINKWTSNIFDDLRGRATGWVRIFGPFKQINIEGDALINEGSLGIPFTGVRYHIENDSVQLRPGHIHFTDARIYDPQGNPGISGHQALVTGHLRHDSFKNLTYDIHLRGQHILGYDFPDFGDQNFYGTVYATGDVTLKGHPGHVRIGIKAHPEHGTTFTYNATSPDKLTQTPFITYKSKAEQELAKYHDDAEKTAPAARETEPETTSDMYIDFDLDIDEQSTMNLLTDTRSGDKITLNGSGHMLAHYYNKGDFSIFGTYRVHRGTYNLTLQDIIHKNFEFSPDGTITFNGEPYSGDLRLQAVHTVSGVSLNDINPKANFSNTSTRVNCLMDITGKARSPHITFDFDIPNANEEEKQMVRSLISTDEERNMQVIYLLGIGRFYAYDYANENQTQGTTAMNSLLSSTLSGTINQALSNMIASRNWNFGANLHTGQSGWSDIDVEGMLQGSLLNNRLLINGNFGYRDNPVATSNFIGDFDVRYLLTRSGTVALKAYSETNDRYFTKSSLTTQGIGVLLKKDFTSWRDLVARRKKKKN